MTENHSETGLPIFRRWMARFWDRSAEELKPRRRSTPGLRHTGQSKSAPSNETSVSRTCEIGDFGYA